MGKERRGGIARRRLFVVSALRLESIPFLLPPFPEKDRREGGAATEEAGDDDGGISNCNSWGDHDTAAECLCLPVRNSTTFRCRFNTRDETDGQLWLWAIGVDGD